MLLVGIIWILGLTYVIVLPVIAAGIVAAVASPLVAWITGTASRARLGAALLLLAIVAVGVGMTIVVVSGITGEAAPPSHLADAKDTIAGWLEDLGLDPARPSGAGTQASWRPPTASRAAQRPGGRARGALLARLLPRADRTQPLLPAQGRPDDPRLGRAAPRAAAGRAQTIGRRVLGSLRGYFLGVTIVAAFNAVVVTLGALLLGVPLAGTIAAVTFIGAYIPYLGAWAAGAFAVLLALGDAGADAAAGMIVVELLANGILQQLVQPFAMGAALGIHPLAVLIVTIGGGALFGMVGLVLAAPMTSAVVRISADLSRARAAEAEAAAAREPPLSPEPAPG